MPEPVMLKGGEAAREMRERLKAEFAARSERMGPIGMRVVQMGDDPAALETAVQGVSWAKTEPALRPLTCRASVATIRHVRIRTIKYLIDPLMWIIVFLYGLN